MTAGEVYERALVPHERGRVARTVVGAVELAAGVFDGLGQATGVGHVVVRRRDDRSEILRLPAGPPEEAAGTLAHVDQQLATLSPQAFLAVYGVTDPAAG